MTPRLACGAAAPVLREEAGGAEPRSWGCSTPRHGSQAGAAGSPDPRAWKTARRWLRQRRTAPAPWLVLVPLLCDPNALAGSVSPEVVQGVPKGFLSQPCLHKASRASGEGDAMLGLLQ